jgi:hypothetical protein
MHAYPIFADTVILLLGKPLPLLISETNQLNSKYQY